MLPVNPLKVLSNRVASQAVRGRADYFINSRDNTKNAFFSKYPPYNANRFVPNDKYRSNYLDVTDLAAFFQDSIHLVTKCFSAFFR